MVLFFAILIFSSLTLSDVYAKTSFTEVFYLGETFMLDGVEYSIMVSSNQKGAMISSMYNDIVVGIEQCTKKDNYEFCLLSINISDLTILADPKTKVQVKLKVTKDDLPQFTLNNLTKLQMPAGAQCSSDQECISKKCLHYSCTYKTNVCGDGYCDDSEICTQDCQRIAKIKNTSVQIQANLDWQDTKTILKKGLEYNFTIIYNYTISNTTKLFSPRSRSALINTSPCPDISPGQVVAKVCSICHMINSTYSITPEEDCTIFFRINDERLVDNKGNAQIHIDVASNASIMINTTSAEHKIVSEQKQVLEKIIRETPQPVKKKTFGIILGTFAIILAIGVVIVISIRRK